MSQEMSFQFGPKNFNGVSNRYEKWKSVAKFGAKILNFLRTVKCSILKGFRKITSDCLIRSKPVDS